jgi:sugar phosphate isomerase/epimerase
MLLAYVEDCLPGRSQAERLMQAFRWGLALEVSNRGNLNLEAYQQSHLPIAAVQAYAMHEFHPLHRDPSHRYQAAIHVRETLEIAASLQAPRIVTVCGFGNELADQPLSRSLDFFSSLATYARSLGVRIMIEPLSPKRAGAMNAPEKVVQLLELLNQPDCFSLMLDTGHLLDSHIDLNDFFEHWRYPIEELQLKGANSTPPNPMMPVQRWLAWLRDKPTVICGEHRQPISEEQFAAFMRSLDMPKSRSLQT